LIDPYLIMENIAAFGLLAWGGFTLGNKLLLKIFFPKARFGLLTPESHPISLKRKVKSVQLCSLEESSKSFSSPLLKEGGGLSKNFVFL